MYVEITYKDKNEASRTMRLVTANVVSIPFLAKKKNRRFERLVGEPKILTDADYQRDKEKGYVD